MKLLVVCQYFYPEQFRVSDVCFRLAEMGHDITVLTGLPNYPMGEVFDGYQWNEIKKKPSVSYDAKLHACLESIRNVKVIRCKLQPRKKGKFQLAMNYLSFWLQGCRTAKAMARSLEYQFDRILVFQFSPITMALPALQFKKRSGTKTPLFLYCFDLWPESIVSFGLPSHGPVYAAVKALSKYIYKNVDHILISSKNFGKYFQSKHSIEDNLSYLPIYAEDLFQTPSDELQNCGSNEPKKLNLVFAGNIGEMQSLETIIRAANHISSAASAGISTCGSGSKPEICVHIVGDGSALEKSIQLSKNLGLMGAEKSAISIEFHGRHPLEAMPGFYDMADAFLVTLKKDPFISYTLPGKVQSYMAFGKPILASINGETADVISESGCGLVCAAEDDKGLAENILKFASMQNKERLDLGVHAKEYYNRNFSSEAFFKALIDLLS